MFPVIFVSLGPGEPELITVKGLTALQAADCIFCPETLTKDDSPAPPTSYRNSTSRKTRYAAFHSP